MANLIKDTLDNLPRKNWVVLDTETTGFTPGVDDVLSLAICDGHGNKIFYELFKAKRNESWPEAEKINGISPCDVADCSYIDDYKSQIEEILAKANVIVGFNASYDIGMLEGEGIVVPKTLPIIDVMIEFAEVYGEWNEKRKCYRWKNLSTACEYYGYKHINAHDAYEDVIATLYVLNSMYSQEQ